MLITDTTFQYVCIKLIYEGALKSHLFRKNVLISAQIEKQKKSFSGF